MNYFFAILFSILIPFFNYYFYKTYQLCGYSITSFFELLFSKGLPFGNKNKLVFTKRMCRAIFVHLLICTTFLFLNFLMLENVALIILNLIIIFLFSPLVLIIAHIIMLPIEKLIKLCYIKRAKKKLSSSDVKVIGITGSYGKTSTKNILKHILEKEFKVCATPLNYNTEMGLTKTILQNLDDEDFLIAEMGARHKGDIKKLCEIAKPDYAILTTVGEQHLQTFGSLENIEQTKAEIIEGSKPSAPIFINCDSPSSYKIYSNCRKNKFATCRFQTYAYATEITYGKTGSKFTLNLEGDKLKVQTRLLGRHNIDNIVLAAAVAFYLGVSKQDIVSAIKTIEPTPHRLELLQNGSITILDDAYNSNPIGATEALNVLSTFKGRKIVITPGFVEMGEQASALNFKLGAQIADVADFCIIMNQENKNFIFSGLISHNFDKNNIFFANSMDEQKTLLTKLLTDDCVVLFENDLPDSYK